jgi:hypothetical protein
MLIRFLRARASVDESVKMLDEHIRWKEEWKPETITMDQVPNALASGCWRILGLSKTNNPIILIQASLWNPMDYELKEYVQYVAWWIETVRKQHQSGVFQNIVIFDLGGWGLSHTYYMNYIAQLANLLQNQYPEMVQNTFLLNVHWLFQVSWNVISGWLDTNTTKKVTFVKQEETGTVLLEYISEDVLPIEYGGKAPMPPCPNIPGIENLELRSSVLGNKGN